ncbi:MAG: hypothetical protein ACYCVS_14365 [Acidimicrobiales bacterium]
MVGDDGLISDPPVRARIIAVLTTLIAHTTCSEDKAHGQSDGEGFHTLRSPRCPSRRRERGKSLLGGGESLLCVPDFAVGIVTLVQAATLPRRTSRPPTLFLTCFVFTSQLSEATRRGPRCEAKSPVRARSGTW